MLTKLYYVFCSIFLFVVLCAYNSFAQSSFIDYIEKSKESIVHITAIQTALADNPKTHAALDKKTGRILISQKAKAAYKQRQGSGVIISVEGHIVTNLHTIIYADKIAVQFQDGTKTSGQILKIYPNEDLALIKINPTFPLNPIPMANSNIVRLGEEIINIGGSALLSDTISAGKITGLGKNKLEKRTKNFEVELIQINMNLYQGDSGGPLFNRSGQLIGMISAKHTLKDRTSFAIPSNKIKKLYIDYLK